MSATSSYCAVLAVSAVIYASEALVFQNQFLDRDALDTASSTGRRRSHVAAETGEQRTCTPLVDHGTYYSVAVLVGTPAQKFDVVTDTGSDSLIIPSCLTGQATCFTGTNRSSTFIAPRQDSEPLQIEFGSGTIVSAVATDTVEIAGINTSMQDGLLLMVGSQLDISEPLEGILGLGRPKPQQDSERLKVPAFLESAGIDRFSVCLNGGGNQPGVLRLDTPPVANGMGSVGHMHWGLDFRGFSVGNISAPVAFCTEEEMQPGQQSPCGAIPDTGTTAIMGPAKQLRELFSNICDAWPRCTEAANNGVHSARPRHEVFQMLLLDCTSWLTDDGLDELPALHLHLSGAGDDAPTQVAKLTGWSYVFQTKLDEVSHASSNLVGVAPLELVSGSPANFAEWSSGVPREAVAESSTQEAKEVCAPAFGTTEYVTSENGPVWIMGLPLFYEYRLSYDRSTEPPTISLSNDEPCGNCGEEASLAIHLSGPASIVSAGTSGRTARSPRQVRGYPRVPRWARKGHPL